MFIVRSSYRAAAASSSNFLHRTKRGFCAVTAEWNVERIRLWVECHRAPAFEAGSTGAHIDFNTDLRNLAGKVRHFAGVRIDLHDVLITEIGRFNKLAVGSIELPENAEFAHFEKR